MSLGTIAIELQGHLQALKQDYEYDFNIIAQPERIVLELDPASAIYVARRIVELADAALPGSTVTFDEADIVDQADIPIVIRLKC